MAALPLGTSAPLLVGSVKPGPTEVRDTRDLDAAFATIIHEHPEALLLLVDPLTLRQRSRIVEFAAEQRLPAIYETRDFVDVCGLISYGPNGLELFRRAATYVDKILRGAKPAGLPIEQPTKFELIINMRAAKRLVSDSPNRSCCAPTA